MNHRLSIDRFEGDRKELAVLLFEDGRTIVVPRDLLPDGARAGAALTMSLALDAAAEKALKKKARGLRDSMKATDPGGDIKL